MISLARSDIRLRRVIYFAVAKCDIPLRGIKVDFRKRKSINCPPHPSRSARHLPRHGKAYRLASADNRGEDNRAILFLYRLFYTVIIQLYCITEYDALLNYCHTMMLTY